MSENKPSQNQRENFEIHNIENYNKLVIHEPKEICEIDKQFLSREDLKKFTWQQYSVDMEAAKLFKEIYHCSLNEIICTALRFYLPQECYDLAEKALLSDKEQVGMLEEIAANYCKKGLEIEYDNK
jgi:hypothetical protein